MTNLEKLPGGKIATENNGTLRQLQEVIDYCFPTNRHKLDGGLKFYYKHQNSKYSWDCGATTSLPIIPLTELWEELQKLKAKPEFCSCFAQKTNGPKYAGVCNYCFKKIKPEIWYINVTKENIVALQDWYPNKTIKLRVGYKLGYYKQFDHISFGFASNGISKGLNYDFGDEIDFATFLEYTKTENEKPVEEIKKTAIKSPPGLLPKKIHDEQVKALRFSEVCLAIKRRYDAGLNINIEWIEEYNELVEIVSINQKITSK